MSSSPAVGKFPVTKTVHRKNMTSMLPLLSELLPYVNHCARHMGRGGAYGTKDMVLVPRKSRRGH